MSPKRTNSASGEPSSKRRYNMILEQRAHKALYDSCKGLTDEQKHVKKVDGKTLFHVIPQ